MRRFLAACLFPALALVAVEPGTAADDGEIRIYRTIMPDAKPSAFALGFPGGISLCYDPVRGGVNYAWTGSFADLSPTWTGKDVRPARIDGEVFYRERRPLPLRRQTAGAVPELEFKGYRLANGRVIFHYLLDGLPVREEIQPLADGVGILRTFHVPADSGPYWFLTEEQPRATVFSPEGVSKEEGYLFERRYQVFSIAVRLQEKTS